MTDYGTIKIPREDYERHNQRRKQMDDSWSEYIDGEAPDTEAFARELVDAVAVEADGQGRVDSDDHAQTTNAESRADAIQSLFEGYTPGVTARVVEMDDGIVEDIANQAVGVTADELKALADEWDRRAEEDINHPPEAATVSAYASELREFADGYLMEDNS